MKNIILYVPSLEDYWYEQKIQADPLSMDYNAGYDVSYYGYHYDTGCIDFPKERWKETYDRRIRENRYFAYIISKKDNKPKHEIKLLSKKEKNKEVLVINYSFK